MTWNIASECVSLIFLCIIWIYARRGNPLPTLRNRFFQICFLITFCAMFFNIISTLMIHNYTTIPLFASRIVTTLYFIATPLMGLVYFWYSVSLVVYDSDKIWKIILPCSFPAIIYFVLILTNPFTKFIFTISAEQGYLQGPLILTTYLIFYVYCLLCVCVAYLNRVEAKLAEKKIVLIFPILAVIVIIIQQFFPAYVLSGSAATCALLLIYLYLENKQISIDYLTGLPNRQVLLGMLKLKLEKRKPEPFVLIVFSLKQFKQINKKYGQENGNLCIKQIADFLNQAVGSNLLYRFSGDEFAILADAISKQDIDTLLQTLYNRMLLPWDIGKYSYVVSVAIGIVEAQEDLNSVEAIVSASEFVVKRAKLDTASSCKYCTHEMLEQANRKEAIIEILKDCIRDDSLEVYFQPIWNIEESSFVLAESLSRLLHTPLGIISPGEFIPIAEDSGLIIPMTYQILDKVCKFASRLMRAGVNFSGISFNLSAVQFTEEGFAEKLLAVIDSNHLPYAKIKIEITESVLADNFDVVKDFMNKMHELGIAFGLDDFGTGYSNIASVLQLTWDTIKLDKSLIWSAIEKRESAVLIRHIVKAFSELDIHVLAEGVETKQQNDFVVDVGCHMIQGFLYAKPLCPEEAEQLFCNKKSN